MMRVGARLRDPMTDSQPATQTTLYHNPNCSKSRGALELLQQLTAEQNLQLVVVEYLTSPLSADDLSQLLSMLPNTPAELIRNDKNFRALALNPDDYQTPDQVIHLLLAHPELLQRPIAVFRDKAAIGRPPEALRALYV